MKNGIKSLIALMMLMTMSLKAQEKIDTVAVLSDMRETRLAIITKNVNPKSVTKVMDSLYYANPMKNNELCLLIYIDDRFVSHKHYVRKEEENKQFKK